MLDFGKIIIYTSNLRIIRASAPRPQTPPPRPQTPHPTSIFSLPRPRGRQGTRGAGPRDGEERQIFHTEPEVKGHCWILVPPVFGCGTDCCFCCFVMSLAMIFSPSAPRPGVPSLRWFRLHPLLSVSWQQVVHVGQPLPPLRQPAALPRLLPPRPGDLHLLLQPQPVGGATWCICNLPITAGPMAASGPEPG